MPNTSWILAKEPQYNFRAYFEQLAPFWKYFFPSALKEKINDQEATQEELLWTALTTTNIHHHYTHTIFNELFKLPAVQTCQLLQTQGILIEANYYRIIDHANVTQLYEAVLLLSKKALLTQEHLSIILDKINPNEVVRQLCLLHSHRVPTQTDILDSLNTCLSQMQLLCEAGAPQSHEEELRIIQIYALLNQAHLLTPANRSLFEQSHVIKPFLGLDIKTKLERLMRGMELLTQEHWLTQEYFIEVLTQAQPKAFAQFIIMLNKANIASSRNLNLLKQHISPEKKVAELNLLVKEGLFNHITLDIQITHPKPDYAINILKILTKQDMLSQDFFAQVEHSVKVLFRLGGYKTQNDTTHLNLVEKVTLIYKILNLAGELTPLNRLKLEQSTKLKKMNESANQLAYLEQLITSLRIIGTLLPQHVLNLFEHEDPLTWAKSIALIHPLELHTPENINALKCCTKIQELFAALLALNSIKLLNQTTLTVLLNHQDPIYGVKALKILNSKDLISLEYFASFERCVNKLGRTRAPIFLMVSKLPAEERVATLFSILKQNDLLTSDDLRMIEKSAVLWVHWSSAPHNFWSNNYIKLDQLIISLQRLSEHQLLNRPRWLKLAKQTEFEATSEVLTLTHSVNILTEASYEAVERCVSLKAHLPSIRLLKKTNKLLEDIFIYILNQEDAEYYSQLLTILNKLSLISLTHLQYLSRYRLFNAPPLTQAEHLALILSWIKKANIDTNEYLEPIEHCLRPNHPRQVKERIEALYKALEALVKAKILTKAALNSVLTHQLLSVYAENLHQVSMAGLLTAELNNILEATDPGRTNQIIKDLKDAKLFKNPYLIDALGHANPELLIMAHKRITTAGLNLDPSHYIAIKSYINLDELVICLVDLKKYNLLTQANFNNLMLNDRILLNRNERCPIWDPAILPRLSQEHLDDIIRIGQDQYDDVPTGQQAVSGYLIRLKQDEQAAQERERERQRFEQARTEAKQERQRQEASRKESEQSQKSRPPQAVPAPKPASIIIDRLTPEQIAAIITVVKNMVSHKSAKEILPAFHADHVKTLGESFHKLAITKELANKKGCGNIFKETILGSEKLFNDISPAMIAYGKEKLIEERKARSQTSSARRTR